MDEELARGRSGLVRVTVHKDRFGHLPRPVAAELEIHSDPDTHAVTWAFRQPASEETRPPSFRPTRLMDRVLDTLAAQKQPIPRRTLERLVGGKRDYTRLAIDALAAEGRIRETRGARDARLYTLDLAPDRGEVKTDDLAPTSPRSEPHNQAENATSSHLAPTSPRNGATHLAHLAPPPTGGRGAGRGHDDAEIAAHLGVPEHDLDDELARLRAQKDGGTSTRHHDLEHHPGGGLIDGGTSTHEPENRE